MIFKYWLTNFLTDLPEMAEKEVKIELSFLDLLINFESIVFIIIIFHVVSLVYCWKIHHHLHHHPKKKQNLNLNWMNSFFLWRFIIHLFISRILFMMKDQKIIFIHFINIDCYLWYMDSETFNSYHLLLSYCSMHQIST